MHFLSRSMLVFILSAAAWMICIPDRTHAEEQTPGQPLTFPREKYRDHPSDLAPDTDPYWKKYQQQQQQRIEQGKPVENPFDKPTESIYESTTHYEVVDDEAKNAAPPKRWGQ